VAAPLACTLSLALLAVSAATGLAQTADPKPAPPAADAKPPVTGKASTTGTTTAETKAPAAAKTSATTSTTAAAKPKAPVTATRSMSPAATSGTTPAVARATRSMTPAPTQKASAAKSPGTTKTDASTSPGAGAPTARTEAPKGGATEGDYTLRGGQEGTVFKSLTVEGEDRVRVDYERPELKLDIELEKAPGLDWGSAADVLNRANRDLQEPLVGLSAKQAPQYLARPWLSEFATGPVARFRPNAEGVERWKLVVVDSKGAPVATFAGKGDPPAEIAWDGRATNGTLVTPGLTYSYVFEAFDRAGNKKNVVGQGFKVTAYRVDAPEGTTLLFSASELSSAAGAQNAPAAPGAGEAPVAPPILLEAASWLNQSDRLSQPIRVTATARTSELAESLAGSVKRTLAPLVLGDPARLDAVAVVEPDAPEAGTLRIAPAK
jgi:hypothetical protein